MWKSGTGDERAMILRVNRHAYTRRVRINFNAGQFAIQIRFDPRWIILAGQRPIKSDFQMNPEGWNWTFNLSVGFVQVAPVIAIFIKSNLSSNRQFTVKRYGNIESQRINLVYWNIMESFMLEALKLARACSVDNFLPDSSSLILSSLIRRARNGKFAIEITYVFRECKDRAVKRTRMKR